MELNNFEIINNELVAKQKNEYGDILNPDVFNYLLKMFDLTLIYDANSKTYNLKNLKTGKLIKGVMSNGYLEFKANNTVIELSDESININYGDKSISFSINSKRDESRFSFYDKKKNFSLNIEASFSELQNLSLNDDNCKSISSLKIYGGYEPFIGMGYDQPYEDIMFCVNCEPDSIRFSGPKDNLILKYDEAEKNIYLIIDYFNKALSLKKLRLKNKDLNLINYFMYDFIKSFLNTNCSIILNNKDYLVKLFSNRKDLYRKEKVKKENDLKKELEDKVKTLLASYESDLRSVGETNKETTEIISGVINSLTSNQKKKSV